MHLHIATGYTIKQTHYINQYWQTSFENKCFDKLIIMSTNMFMFYVSQNVLQRGIALHFKWLWIDYRSIDCFFLFVVVSTLLLDKFFECKNLSNNYVFYSSHSCSFAYYYHAALIHGYIEYACCLAKYRTKCMQLQKHR